jgi:hypothetical protein
VKLIKLTALILSAVLLLCSCGNETSDDQRNLSPESETTIAETQNEEVPDDKETERANETLEESAKPAEKVTFETAQKNAEIIFDKAGELFIKAEENGSTYTHLVYIGVLGKSVAAMPELPEVVDGEYVENALNYLTEGEIGGVYTILIESSGEFTGVIWSPSFNSTVVAIYPFQIAEGNDATISDQLLYMYKMEEGFYSDIDTRAANATAQLVFQNAATYLTKAQIAGATFDSLIYSGTLETETEKPPEINFGEALTEDDLNRTLNYYMSTGGENDSNGV